MNLSAMAGPLVATVNPPVAGVVRRSAGYTTAGDGTRAPTYASDVPASFQVQPLSTGDIKRLDALNIQSIANAVYVNAQVSGVDRATGKGGDLLVYGGRTWLVVEVLEAWTGAGWCKAAVKAQMP